MRPKRYAGTSQQTLYARRLRKELLQKLGAECKLCGEDDEDKLEFDHIYGRDYDLRKLSSSARMARYKREEADGLLRVLCGDCNNKERKQLDSGKIVRTNDRVEVTDNMPF